MKNPRPPWPGDLEFPKGPTALELPRIAITMGDPAGIGPEVIVKAFSDSKLYRECRPIVIGDANYLVATAKQFAPTLSIRPITSIDEAEFDSKSLVVLDLNNVQSHPLSPEASAVGGQATVEYIRKAVDLAMARQVDAITTAPINKESIHLAGFHYPGHTEMLADFTGSKSVALMLAGKKLRVVIATTHVPLHEVKELITTERVTKILHLTHQWLHRYVKETPKIAVTGLNPHCGDGGIFGNEEKTAILPAIKKLQAEGIDVQGPFSADALFARTPSDTYDAVVTMYHDQGMIPIKMESQGEAVNVTLGLPILRTSVDHGTAFDIAGQGLASPESLKISLRFAANLAQSVLAVK
jgi:4-hydroxythreonine-4-phosphate dehydrogenase